MQKKNILIVTDEIAPPAFAPRIVSLCRYLHQKGWHCAVFSDCLPNVQPYTDENAEWYQTHYYGNKLGFARYFADKVFLQREKEFMHFVEKKINVADFDIILCSSCYYFPLQTAKWLAQKYHLPYIVDLRDLAEQWGNLPYQTHRLSPWNIINTWGGKLYQNLQLLRRNRVLRQAQAVVTVSSWHQALLKQYNPNTHLIYNGFDEWEFVPEDVKTPVFRIGYTGKIYNIDFRDPRLMMQAVAELVREGKLNQKHLEIVFHIDTPSIPTIQTLAQFYGIEQVCRIQGYIPKSELSDFLHQTSVLLVLTCLSTPRGAHGILGTKFYEALGVEKPVLCVRSDEECLAEIIRITHAGVAACNVEQAKTFLLEQYKQWQAKGFTRQPVIQTEKQRFTRQYEAAQWEQILSSLANVRKELLH